MTAADDMTIYDGRAIIPTTTGNVHGWPPEGSQGGTVCASFALVPSRGGNSESHASFSQFMTVADARSLASALTRAADHAESLLQQEVVV